MNKAFLFGIKAPWHSKAGMCLQGDAAGKLHQLLSLNDSAADACELQAARHEITTVAAAVQLNLSMTDCTHTWWVLQRPLDPGQTAHWSYEAAPKSCCQGTLTHHTLGRLLTQKR